MWKLREKLVPVITGALGTVKEGSDQNLQLIPGHLSATELQKITLMSIAHNKGRRRSLLCSQKTGRKGSEAARSSPCSRNYKTSGICR